MIRHLTEPELIAEGEALGRRLAPKSILALEGELGVGKTTFAQAVVRGLGVLAPAPSPTYGLVHRYQGRRGAVFHLDCYRLKCPDDAADLDWETLLMEGDAILVEWPERAGPWLPRPTRRIRFLHLPDADLRGMEELP